MVNLQTYLCLLMTVSLVAEGQVPPVSSCSLLSISFKLLLGWKQSEGYSSKIKPLKLGNSALCLLAICSQDLTLMVLSVTFQTVLLYL